MWGGGVPFGFHTSYKPKVEPTQPQLRPFKSATKSLSHGNWPLGVRDVTPARVTCEVWPNCQSVPVFASVGAKKGNLGLRQRPALGKVFTSMFRSSIEQLSPFAGFRIRLKTPEAI